METSTNNVKKLKELGQSVWLDFISRDLIVHGALQKLLKEDGICGVISNHANFEKAVNESHIYDEEIKKLSQEMKDTKLIYEAIMLHDIQLAADQFCELYNKTNGAEGYVSLKVNSYLAHDTKGTIEEARRLWSVINRPNILIKIPATPEGCVAIQQLLCEGINVNATLIFGLRNYLQVIYAYFSGLEARISEGKSIDHVTSVASFYLGNIDEFFEPILEKLIQKEENVDLAQKMKGKVSISIAKAAYQNYMDSIDSGRFKRLQDRGVRQQRLVWTNFDDIRYIDALIGPETIVSLKPEMLESYRINGKPQIHIEDDVEQAIWITQQLSKLGSNIDIINQQLECKGVETYDQSYDKMLDSITKASTRLFYKE